MPEPDAHDSEESPKKPAAPLQLIGLGLVIVFVNSIAGGYDLLANPVGWVLVLIGTAKLPLPRRDLLAALSVVALLVSVPLWFPAVHEPLVGADASLDWAAKLPTYGYAILLCRQLMEAARPVHKFGYMRFGTLSVMLVVAVLVPPVAVAAESAVVSNLGVALVYATQIWLIWSLFSHSRRPYADAPPAAAADA